MHFAEHIAEHNYEEIRMRLLSEKTLRNLFALSFSMVLFTSTIAEVSWGDMVVEDLKTPVTAVLQEELSVETTQAGSSFTAITQEDYLYKTSILPAGSRIIGKVEKVKKSKRLGRPGYLQLKITQVEFPDGQIFTMPETVLNKRNKEKKVKAQRHYHPEAKTKSGMMKSNMVSMIAGSSTTIALTSVGTFSSPYALGARVVAGAIWEGFKGDKQKPLYKRLAKGGWRGTGVPGMYYYIKKEPNPNFEANADIELHMNPYAYEELLKANANPDADWENPDFKRVKWDDYDSLDNYAKMAEQLQDVPEAVLTVKAQPQPSSSPNTSEARKPSREEVYSPDPNEPVFTPSPAVPDKGAYDYLPPVPGQEQEKSSTSAEDTGLRFF